jgi:hypothetical protein
MSRNLIATITISVATFGLVVVNVELGLNPFLIIAGALVGCGLAFGFLTLRNKFLLFLLLLTLLLSSYFTWKTGCRATLYALPLGAVIGLLLVWAWVLPHRPFRRSGYIASQRANPGGELDHE